MVLSSPKPKTGNWATWYDQRTVCVFSRVGLVLHERSDGSVASRSMLGEPLLRPRLGVPVEGVLSPSGADVRGARNWQQQQQW